MSHRPPTPDGSELFDVVIYNLHTSEIDAVVGERLRLDTGFHNAEKRLETALSRINDRYNAVIVPAGKYRKGDKLEARDQL